MSQCDAFHLTHSIAPRMLASPVVGSLTEKGRVMRQGKVWRVRSLVIVAALSVLSVVALAGCASGAGAKASVKTQPTATATAIPPTQTPIPATATPSGAITVVSQVSFTCPATVNGSSKTFSDGQTGFSFSYPASWTETQCQRTVTSDGATTLSIGQVFNVRVIPRTGEDALYWVQSQKEADETVTTTPITVQQAMEAYQIQDNPGPNTPENHPLGQAGFIIMGSRNLYVIYTLIAQTETQDTLINVPPLQIVQTMSVNVN